MPTLPRRPSSLRVLVTGAAGFIGGRLAHELCAAGHRVLGLDDFSTGWPERLPRAGAFELVEGDVSAPGVLARLVAREEPHVLVHLAARVGVRAVLRDPEGCRAANLRGVGELLTAVEALPRARRPRVLAASSSEVYAEKPGPLREGDPTRPTDGAGRWAYAASKLRGEELLDASGLWDAARGPLHLRFFNVVGPGQDGDSGMVLPTFVERALDGRPIPVHGDGAQVRTFAHVDEVARALRALVEAEHAPGGALNVGGAARTSILALARLVAERAGRGSAVRFTDPRARCGANFEDVRFREPDLARLAELGVAAPALDLTSLVDDSLARHRELARPRAATSRGPAPCASPAS
ncbi:MAG: NAD-dependent epimerase/dehydratase family protein [Planctomycetes bacterium]|nr:NAD-dependent epimerase/dehydratase family protein [Planctomycetota bacterium]